MTQLDLIDHGVAVRRGSMMSHLVCTDPVDGREKVYLGINQGHDDSVGFLLVQLDPQTGACRQVQAPEGCVGPWGMAEAPEGRIVITSIGGNVCVFDPRDGAVHVAAKANTWFWTITRGEDGRYYLGSHPDAMLWRFDLDSRELVQIGSLHAEQPYLRIVMAGGDGYLYGSVGATAAQVVAWHMASGSFRPVLPKQEESPNFHRLGSGADGTVQVQCFTGSIYRLRHGQAEPIDASTWSGFVPAMLGDGRAVRYCDPDAVRIGEDDSATTWPVNYEGSGTSIFHLAEGPNGCVYGSTLLPLYLFRYDPAADKLECLGRGCADNGEAYSIGHVDAKLYYATYPSGLLMCYDPAQPWQPTPQWDRNPKQIPLGAGHCRPRAMVVDDQKRVWVGSHAEYGLFHGGLAWYDTVAGKLENNPLVIPNQSIASLASEPTGRIIFGGTDIARGSGVAPSTSDAILFAWDVEQRRVLWQHVPFPGHRIINNLLYRDGLLFGTTQQGEFFIADAQDGRVRVSQQSTFAAARDQSMTWAPDGNIYGITWMALFRFRPSGELEPLERHVDDELARSYGGSVFHRGAAIINGRIYFSSGARVLSMALPLES